MSETFDETYFERGVEAHVSGYTDYKWKPEYVMPLANWLKQKFPNKIFLDYGCAKGFLVKALRLLGCKAYGFDISVYAINNCESEVKDYCFNTLSNANIIIAKDVLEHIPENEIQSTVIETIVDTGAEYVVAIIPLGDEDKFRIREYELDITHVTKKDEVWWINKFEQSGFICEEFYYALPGIKENWTSKYPHGNGIFIFKRKL